MTTTSAPTAFRIRWWHIAIVLVLLTFLTAFVVGISLRTSGRAKFMAQAAARRALHRPATIEDYLAAAPVVDAAAQAAWDTWSKSAMAGWKEPNYDLKAWNLWVTGQGNKPASIVTTIEANRAVYASALALLRRGDLVLSAYGWAAADLPPGKRTLADAAAVRMPNLLVIRALAEWLHYDAVLSADPRPSLADLDALVTSQNSHPGSLIDAMIAVAVGDIRDRTYVDLALLGTLPADCRDRWLAEPSQTLRCVADGFDGEAGLYVGGLFTMIDTGGPWSMSSLTDVGMGISAVGRFFVAPYIWATGHADAAVMLEVDAAVADRMRGVTTAPVPTWESLKPRLSSDN